MTDPEENSNKVVDSEVSSDETSLHIMTNDDESQFDSLVEVKKVKLPDSDKNNTKDHEYKRFVRIRKALDYWWNNTLLRNLSIFIIIASVISAALIPYSRYAVLNLFGTRVTTNITILDEKSDLPLKNVQITIQGKSLQTNKDGVVEIKDLKLGSSDIIVEKRAFATQKHNVVLGWGSNQLKPYRLTPTGSRYAYVVTDWLSGKPIKGAELSTQYSDATSAEDGKLILTIDSSDDEVIGNLKSPSYIDQKITINKDSKSETLVKMVANKKHIFISKRSGKYDIYSVNPDGTDEKLVLSGTGNERDDMVIVVHPTKDVFALVSTRDGQRNNDGFVKSGLYIVDLKDGKPYNIAASEQFHILGWLGDRLGYVQIKEGASATNPKRNRLISYNLFDDTKTELAASNYFNDVLIASGSIYYAPSNAFLENSAAYLYRVNPDGSSKTTIMDKEAWNVFRVGYDHFKISYQNDWYDFVLNDSKAVKSQSPPVVLKTRIYIDSPDKKHALWSDSRDGKGVLLYYDITTKLDKTIASMPGLKLPVTWLDNTHVVFRVSNPSESADYALNIEGGNPVKIKDVSDTSGVDRWYYY